MDDENAAETTPDGETCGSCSALLAPSTAYPWHLPDEDCRAIRTPKED